MPSAQSHDHEDLIDIDLMKRIGKGDASAMEELITRHQHSVYATIFGMLHNSPETDDIAQQVFINIWKAASTYQPTAKFKTWLFAIVKNQVFNEMRRLKRKPAFSADAFEEAKGLIVSIDKKPSPDEEALQHELQKTIDKAIAELPEKARLAIQLRRYENMSYEEIAHILKTSVSATKSLLFRARAQLKEELDKYLE